MIPIYRKDYHDGELRLGWPTWDPTGKKHGEMGIKYSYLRSDGRPSRGSPELPVSIAVDMIVFAAEHRQLTQKQVENLKAILKQVKSR